MGSKARVLFVLVFAISCNTLVAAPPPCTCPKVEYMMSYNGGQVIHYWTAVRHDPTCADMTPTTIFTSQILTPGWCTSNNCVNCLGDARCCNGRKLLADNEPRPHRMRPLHHKHGADSRDSVIVFNSGPLGRFDVAPTKYFQFKLPGSGETIWAQTMLVTDRLTGQKMAFAVESLEPSCAYGHCVDQECIPEGEPGCCDFIFTVSADGIKYTVNTVARPAVTRCRQR